MADMLEDGLTWLASQMKYHAGQAVTIRRGGGSCSATATIGRAEVWGENSGATHNRFEGREFLIDAADYSPNGTVSLPANDDEIDVTIGGVLTTWYVKREAGAPPYVYSDPYRIKLRIHAWQGKP